MPLAHVGTPWPVADATRPTVSPRRRGGRVWSWLGALDGRPGFWLVLWTVGGAAQIAALWPFVVGDGPATWSQVAYRVTGGSFVAAGLIAWRRRPENRVGALMVATGFLFFAEQLPADVDASLLQTLAMSFSGYWMIPFAVLLLVFPQGRWIRGRLEQLVVAAARRPPAAAAGLAARPRTSRGSPTISASGRTTVPRTGSTRPSAAAFCWAPPCCARSSAGAGGTRARRSVACSYPCWWAERQCSRSPACSPWT